MVVVVPTIWYHTIPPTCETIGQTSRMCQEGPQPKRSECEEHTSVEVAIDPYKQVSSTFASFTLGSTESRMNDF